MVRRELVIGAVAYDVKVVTIWEGFKAWFAEHDLGVDYVLYSQYERQAEALIGGNIDIAWNSPLAWVRSERLARVNGLTVRALAMRDTDQDLTSIIIVRADSGLGAMKDLRDRRIAVGAVDSPQATLLPLSHLRAVGVVGGTDCEIVHYDAFGGKHGDHIGGERDAAKALIMGDVDAACLVDSNHLRFIQEGTLRAGATRVLTQTEPYDHCNFTTTLPASDESAIMFVSLLCGMRYGDDLVRPLFDLEGLKEWRTGRTTGYTALERAVDEANFYDYSGAITAADYRY
jgi:phosphonate transport system substrate-binding protein